MKKIFFFLTLLSFAQFGQSVTYVQDSFPVDGNLNGKSPTIGSGTWTSVSGTLNQMQVTGGRAQIVTNATEDLALTNSVLWGGGGSIFAGFTIKMLVAPGNASGDYIAAFRSGVNFYGRIFTLRPGPLGTFRLGLSNNGGTAGTNWLTDLSTNQDYRVVVRLTENGANDNAALWVNPTGIGDTSIATTNINLFSSINSFLLRQGSGASYGSSEIDDLIVDDSFAAAAGRILSIDNTGNPLASSNPQGATDRPVFGFQLTANNQNIDFTAVNIARTLGNGAQVGDFSNYRLFYDNDNNGFDVGDDLLSTVPADNANLNFAGIVGQTVQVGTPRRYVVVADVAGGAVPGGTVGLQIVNNTDITVNSGTVINTAAPYPAVLVTHSVQDATPPLISILDPADNAINVALNANLVIQFNETINAGLGNITLVETGVGNFEVIPANNPNVNIVGNTVTIDPAGTLDPNKAYHVLIDAGAFTDIDANPFAGINDQVTWNFTTVASQVAIDNTGNPVAIDLNQGAVDQPIYGFQLTAANGNVNFTDVTITRSLGNGAQVGDVSNYRLFFDNDNNGFDAGDLLLATVPVDNNTLNFTGFNENVLLGVPRRYVVVADVAANAVDNGTIGLQIQNNADLSVSGAITTLAPYPNAPINHTIQDVTAPTVITLDPPDNGVNVDPNANLVAQFSEPLVAGVGNITVVETGVGDFEVIPVGDPKITIIGNTVTINPAGSLDFGTDYHVLIDNGALLDAANNAFTGILDATTWNFSTIPTLLSVDNTGNPGPSNLNQGATDQPIYGFQLSAANGDIDFTGVTLARVLGNGAIAGNVNNYRLFFDNDNNGFDAGDLLLATVPADNATLNFGGIAGQTLAAGTSRRYVIIADVAANAIDNGTVSLQIQDNTDILATANLVVTVAPYPNAPVAHTFQDVTAPTFVLLNPLDNAIDVATTANLIIQFNENVAAGAGNITLVETGVGNFEVIPVNDSRITILGNSVTINPNGNLNTSTGYHVLIDNGAIVDLANNAFAGINNPATWNFTTAAQVNTAPTIEGGGIADVIVDENAPPTIVNLGAAFQDAETADADLVYSVTATNFISGDAEIFSSIDVDNNADTLTLNYLANSNGVFTITVRATDAGNLFVEDTFQVTVNADIEPVGSITNLVVTPTNGFVFIGKTLQLTATGLATNGSTNVTLGATWSSAATNIATVNNAGVVTGMGIGDVIISAVFDNLTNSVTVQVRKELLITFSKIKPAKRTPKLKAGKGFTVKGKFYTGTNTFTKSDITSRPLRMQLALLSSVTNTNGVTGLTFQDVTKIKGFKATKPKSIGKFIAKPVGSSLPAGNATVLLRAFLGPEGTNQEVSQVFTNPTPFEVRRK